MGTGAELKAQRREAAACTPARRNPKIRLAHREAHHHMRCFLLAATVLIAF